MNLQSYDSDTLTLTQLGAEALERVEEGKIGKCEKGNGRGL